MSKLDTNKIKLMAKQGIEFKLKYDLYNSSKTKNYTNKEINYLIKDNIYKIKLFNLFKIKEVIKYYKLFILQLKLIKLGFKYKGVNLILPINKTNIDIRFLNDLIFIFSKEGYFTYKILYTSLNWDKEVLNIINKILNKEKKNEI